MVDFLFELGCEELPAGSVARASADLERLVLGELGDAGLSWTGVERYATPRRLILSVTGLPEGQADSVVEKRGPAEGSAFHADGMPTKALEGFCRGAGVDPGSVEVRDGYVWVRQEVKGRLTGDLLAEVLPKAIRGLTFDKTMRWGSSRMRFARPIRWILAVLGGDVVSFDIEGVASGRFSRGHRFDFPEPFEALTLDGLLRELRARHVEPDAEVRRARILEQAKAVAWGTPDLPEGLVDENVFLTEWPTAHEGSFDPGYLDLPEPVLVTAMAKHERFFPVRGEDGRLVNTFVSIRNSGEEASVKAGNEWVLNARFNDARFFFEEDQRKSLDDFLAATERMLFQDKLGTVRQRADRLADLTGFLIREAGGSEEEVAEGSRAARYAKADLATGLVSELSSLQGVIGGAYAEREGFSARSARAIGVQYKPEAAAGDLVSETLVAADQTDKLAGFLGLGLVPKGSSDPFGLRRCATVLIELAWEGSSAMGYEAAFEKALALYAGQGMDLDGVAVRQQSAELFRSRYEALMPDLAPDVFEAAVGAAPDAVLLEPKTVRARAQAMAVLDKDATLVVTLRRPLTILASAERKGALDLPDALSPEALDSDSGVALASAMVKASREVHHGLRREEPALVAQELRDLAGFVHDFFEGTMIMAEDPQVRTHRLKLVAETAAVILSVGDFTRIVLEGEKRD